MTIRAQGDGYPGTPKNFHQSAVIDIPSDWFVAIKSEGQLKLETKTLSPGNWGPMIHVSFWRLDLTAGATANEQVEALLKAIHVKEDPTVELEEADSIETADSGTFPVWYLHSPQYGYRLHAKQVSGKASFTVRLICDSPEELEEYGPAFRALVQSAVLSGNGRTRRSTTNPTALVGRRLDWRRERARTNESALSRSDWVC